MEFMKVMKVTKVMMVTLLLVVAVLQLCWGEYKMQASELSLRIVSCSMISVALLTSCNDVVELSVIFYSIDSGDACMT